ncbi:hypothetical protein TWF281_001438 [Arthrobotrys megalospora]
MMAKLLGKKSMSLPSKVSPQEAHLDAEDILILCIGPTGAGKTAFINFSGAAIQDGASADYLSVRASFLTVGKHRIALIDTPGIDDTSDTTTHSLVTEWLQKSYPPGKQISAIAYIQSISAISSDFDGDLAMKTLRIFEDLYDERLVVDGRLCLITNFWCNPPTQDDCRAEYKVLDRRGSWKRFYGIIAQYYRFRWYDMPAERCEAQNMVDEILMGLVERVTGEKMGGSFGGGKVGRIESDRGGQGRLAGVGRNTDGNADWMEYRKNFEHVLKQIAGVHVGLQPRNREEGESSDEEQGLEESDSSPESQNPVPSHEKVLIGPGDDPLEETSSAPLNSACPCSPGNGDVDAEGEVATMTRPPRRAWQALNWKVYRRLLARSIRNRFSDACLESTEEAAIIPSQALFTPIHEQQYFALWDAVATGQLRKVRRALNTPVAQIDQKTECGCTALMRAVWDKYSHIVTMLLKEGASPTRVKDKNGVTALHLAVFAGYHPVIKLLIKYADGEVDPRTDGDSTPLHVASLQGHAKIVKILLDSGADHSARNGMGRTPLYYAVRKENWEIAGILVRAGAKVDEGGLESIKLAPSMLLRLAEPRGTDTAYRYWTEFMKLLGESNEN